MKNSILAITFILIAFQGIAQHLFYKPGENFYYRRDINNWDGGEAFEVTETPEKWKNESGVIIAYKSQEHFSGKGKYQYRSVTFRYRIKIQDKAAVESFSSTFNRDLGRNFGIKIVKPDGKEIFLDPDDLSDEKRNAATEKFSIPNLEVGDILDYYYSGYEVTSSSSPPEMESFSNSDEEFPIMYKEVEWIMDKNFQFKFKGVNGVPSIDEKWYDSHGGEIEIKDESRMRYKHYILRHEDISRQADSRYVYNAQVIPFVRYQIFLATVPFTRFSNPKTKLHRVETNYMSYKDISDFVYEEQRKFKSDYSIRTLKAKYNPDLVKKSEGRTAQQTIDLVEAIHHTVRFQSSSLFYSNIDLGSLVANNSVYRLTEYLFSSLNQVFSLANEFDENNIDYDIIAITPKNIGLINEVMFEDELKYAIRINLPDGNKLYYSGFGLFNDYFTNNYLLEGAKGIVIDPKKKRSEEVKFEEVTFPISTYQENMNVNTKRIKVSDDLGELEVDNENSYTGKLKFGESVNVLSWLEVFDSYWNEYETGPANERTVERDRSNLELDIDKNRKEKYKKRLESDFDVKSYDELKIVNTGITEGEPLIVHDKFVLEGMVKKAGKNFIFNAGILIGSQVALEDDEYDRTLDAFLTYQRTFSNKIIVELPDGYTISDLSSLNVEFENEAGKFLSHAEMDGNQLIFNTEKSYKCNFLPSTKWSLMTEFLDTAFDLSQKKVLISKL